MYESVPAASAWAVGRRQLLAPVLALGISVTVGIGLLAAAILSVAPADRMVIAVWVSIAVAAACTAVATAVYFRGLITAEQRRTAEALDRLARSEQRAAVAEQAVAAEKEVSATSERRHSDTGVGHHRFGVQRLDLAHRADHGAAQAAAGQHPGRRASGGSARARLLRGCRRARYGSENRFDSLLPEQQRYDVHFLPASAWRRPAGAPA
ncbi:hypothetical protein [Nocardia sp. NPDC002869]|uniref:hypothetical protein n=1 Tax=Nocardia sp. NPDC002869 TaxID=3161032 RepID=UPI00398CF991